jgi:hypothetical protein
MKRFVTFHFYDIVKVKIKVNCQFNFLKKKIHALDTKRFLAFGSLVAATGRRLEK